MRSPPPGASFANVQQATAVTTLLAPASNTKGCWLRTLNIDFSAGTVQIYADTAAPLAAGNDTTKRCIAQMVSGQVNTGDRWLPAGIGIFGIGGIAAAGFVAVTWDLAS